MSHSHAPAPTSAGAKHRWRLAVSFAMVAAFFGVELAVGLWSGSLALLSDAGHMAADVVALGSGLLATWVGARPDKSGRRTYGHYRVEVFASGLTVLIMLGVAVYVVVEAIGRIGRPAEITSSAMLVVGVIGLVINVVSMLLLHGGSKESLTVKGAYLEVIADAAGSVGVIVAGLLVSWTGRSWWDTVIALAIGLFVAVRAILLGRQVLAVLAQEAPVGVDVAAVTDALKSLPDVLEVHDVHVWALTSGMDVATVHLLVCAGADQQVVLEAAQTKLADDFGIEHTTIQVEFAPTERCSGIGW